MLQVMVKWSRDGPLRRAKEVLFDRFCLKPEVKNLDGSLSGVDKSLLK